MPAPRPRRCRHGGARHAADVAAGTDEGAGLQRDPLFAQRARHRLPATVRPDGVPRHGREPQLQSLARLYGAAGMAGAARPQSPQRHPVVGVQRRADAGHGGGCRDGAADGSRGAPPRRQPASDRGDERVVLQPAQCVERRRCRRVQLLSRRLRQVPSPESDQADDEFGGYQRVHDARRLCRRCRGACPVVDGRSCRGLGRDASRRLGEDRRPAVRRGRLRVDGLRLSWRADALRLAYDRELFRDPGPLRLSQDRL